MKDAIFTFLLVCVHQFDEINIDPTAFAVGTVDTRDWSYFAWNIYFFCNDWPSYLASISAVCSVFWLHLSLFFGGGYLMRCFVWGILQHMRFRKRMQFFRDFLIVSYLKPLLMGYSRHHQPNSYQTHHGLHLASNIKKYKIMTICIFLKKLICWKIHLTRHHRLFVSVRTNIRASTAGSS